MSNAISSLESAIAANPFDEASYKTLIPLISVDTDRAKLYREAYATNFLTDVTFWADWLAQELRVDLFEKALTHCPHFELAIKYIEHSASLVEEDKLSTSEYRSILERMIVLCGSDVFTGSEIWKYYREFEVDEHEDLVDMEATPEEVQKSKERFIKVYNRQLSLPLVGNEETLKEFEQKLGELCVASDASLINPAELERKVSAAKEMREGRLIYEMHLLSDKYAAASSAEKEASWMGYIAYEKKQAQLSRTQRLFERAVLECPSSFTLWLEFTDFALSVLKNWALLASVTQRALKVFRSSVFLWRLRLISLESSSEAAEDLQAAQQAALASGLGNVEEYLDIYLTFCDYHRRQLELLYAKLQAQKSASAEVTERAAGQVEALQGALAQVQVFLHSYGANWVAGWWRACKYQAQVEATLIAPVQEVLSKLEAEQAGPVMAFGGKNASKKAPKAKMLPGSEVWETATKLFPTSYFLWSEYVQWARQLREFEHCRKVYRKMTNLELDVSAAEVCKEWVSFEQQHGGLQDIQAALSRAFVHARSELLQAYTTPAASASSGAGETDLMQVDSVPAEDNNRSRKRKAAAEERAGASSQGPAAHKATLETSPSAKKVKFAENKDKDTAPAAAALVELAVPVPAAPIAPHAELSNSTVVVANFPFHATMDSIRPMLEDKCSFSAEALAEAGVAVPGHVKDMRLLLSKAGHSRGAVEVEFAPVASYSDDLAALNSFLHLVVNTLQGYVYNERSLKAEIKSLPVPGAEASKRKEKVDPLVLQQRAGSVTAPHLTTVFISHLPLDVSTAQLKEHFGSCGEVLAAKVAVDKKTGESKGTGLVQFSNEAGRHAALQLNKSQFHGALLGVAPSRFSLITVAETPVDAAHPSGAAVRTVEKSARKESAPVKDAHIEEPAPLVSSGAANGDAHVLVPASTKPAPAKFSNTSFKPRNLVKQAPKGKINL